jgi:hypothetical protein
MAGSFGRPGLDRSHMRQRVLVPITQARNPADRSHFNLKREEGVSLALRRVFICSKARRFATSVSEAMQSGGVAIR